jgi:hypothetical protein
MVSRVRVPRVPSLVQLIQTFRRIVKDQFVVAGPLSKSVTGECKILKVVRLAFVRRSKNGDTSRRTILMSQPSPAESDPLHSSPSSASKVLVKNLFKFSFLEEELVRTRQPPAFGSNSVAWGL